MITRALQPLFSSEFLQCFNDPSQPGIYFSGVSRLGSLLPGYWPLAAFSSNLM